MIGQLNINSLRNKFDLLTYQIKDTMKAFDDFRNKQQVYEVFFLYVKVCIF